MSYLAYIMTIRFGAAQGREAVQRESWAIRLEVEVGTGDETRTRDPLLGKQAQTTQYLISIVRLPVNRSSMVSSFAELRVTVKGLRALA